MKRIWIYRLAVGVRTLGKRSLVTCSSRLTLDVKNRTFDERIRTYNGACRFVSSAR